MKKLRMLSLGLAMSLLFAQTAQAEVFITPFGETIEVSTESAASAESAGPGAVQIVDQVMKPSATYSTKEAVQVKTQSSTGTQNGPGAAQSTTSTTTSTAAGSIDSSAAASVTAPTIWNRPCVLSA